MKLHIILAHPSPTSFNAALCKAAAGEATAQGHEVTISDLYRQEFDAAGGPSDFLSNPNADGFHYQSEQRRAALDNGFAADVAREQDRLRNADCLMLQFPIWWGGPPAILKGWIDRVSAYGVTYADGLRFDRGLFRGRRSLVSVTTGGTEQRFTDAGGYGDIEKVLWSVQRLFLAYLGYDVMPTHVSHAVARTNESAREAMTEALRAQVRSMLSAPMTAISIPSPQEILDGTTGNWASGV